MTQSDPIEARQFAVQVVRRLRDAGYEALWAGGCVRDRLMGREPKDYDIATNAVPDEIREVFGRKRTLAIGASFGVITVLGPREVGQIDVATFRRDAQYSDGRHPDAVTFSTAREDAQRRDFTINGLFFDPLRDEVIDYVGGREDLERSVIRAIGDPEQRFAEDKLRMLRALRFATTLSFEIDVATMAAIQRTAAEIGIVSAERIAEELRKMLVHPSRHRALELLRESQLLPFILPDCASLWPLREPAAESQARAWDLTIRMLEHLQDPTFAVAFALVLREAFLARGQSVDWVRATCRTLRLSTDEREGIVFCLVHEPTIRAASSIFWPTLQRVLVAPRVEELLAFAEAVAEVLDGHAREIRFCREKLQLPADRLNPPPLVTGDDLRGLGIPAGPVYKQLLEQARDAQLNGLIVSAEDARDWLRTRWLSRSESRSPDFESPEE